MVNTQYLEKFITESGKKKQYLADKMGISRQAFAKKLNNEIPFKLTEYNILCSELSITSIEDRDKCFFTKKGE